MTHRDLLWTTDRNLQITMLSARLCNLLFPNGAPSRLHVSELWRDDDSFGMMIVAHQWALEGDRMAFDTERRGIHLRITLEPLYDLSGAIAGVGGRATPGVGNETRWELEELEDVERICGFGAWRTDFKTGRMLWSQGIYEILGLEKSSEIWTLRAFDHPDDAEAVASIIKQGEIAGTGYRCDHRIVRPDCSTRHVHEQMHVVYAEDGVACALVGCIADITERKEAEKRLAQLADYDPVSKLPNRTLLEQRLHAALSRAQQSGTGCAVLFIDVDDFKGINDTYGHAAGDKVLKAIGARLSHHVRAGDTVARMSGDKFVIVLGDLRSIEDAQYAARKILKSFEVPFHIEGRGECRVGVSIGVAMYPENPAQAKALFDIADREMYIVKRNGGRGIKIACASSSKAHSHLHTAASG